MHTEEPRVVILGHAFWEQHFGGSLDAVGRSIRLDGKPLTVVGVMPREITLAGVASVGVQFPSATDVWIPLPLLAKGPRNRMGRFMRPLGLLRPGISQAHAQSELDSIAQGIAAKYPATNTGWKLRLQPLADVVVGQVRQPLWILLGAVTFVLLIACANVANLLLARSTVRQKEVAIRLALGASQSRIFRQFLTESVLLAGLSGGVGLLLSWWSLTGVRSVVASQVPQGSKIALDGAVLAFTVLVSLLTGLVFGVGPAMRAGRGNVQQALQETGQALAGGRSNRLRNIFVSAEMALSVTLLACAGLLINSLWRLSHVNPGFQPENVVSARIFLPSDKYEDQQRRDAFFKQVMDQIKGLPGVKATGAVSELPLSGQLNDMWFTIAEHPPADPNQKEDASFRVVTPDYFQTLQIPLLQGRSFTDRDNSSAPAVVIIDEPFAQMYFPGQNPLGQHLVLDRPREIVGIIGGIRHFNLQSPPSPEMYIPEGQTDTLWMNLVIHTAGDPTNIIPSVRNIVGQFDKDQAIGDFQFMRSVVAATTAPERLTTVLLSLFAGIALLLASGGIYAVISYVVGQRRREIGLRIALGAQPQDIIQMILRHSLKIVAAGLLVGIVAALVAARVLSGQLYEVSTHDPATFILVSALLLGVAVVASYIPARRAGKVDPIITLRYE